MCRTLAMGNTATKLILIAKKAKEEPKYRFTYLKYLLNEAYLKECYDCLQRGKAAGVDGRTVESYTEVETFDFLGFTHYCSQTRDGRFAMKVKTSRKKFNAAKKAQNLWLKAVRNIIALPNIWKTLALKLQGHYQYYGISGNFESIKSYYQQTQRQAYKWLNRRSQKKSWNWDSFRDYLKLYPLPQPKITYAFYNTW